MDGRSGNSTYELQLGNTVEMDFPFHHYFSTQINSPFESTYFSVYAKQLMQINKFLFVIINFTR
jgi:hypothetical protein